MNARDQFKNILLFYQTKTEGLIQQRSSIFGSSGPLRDACEYALSTGGRRFRPALVFMVAEALGKQFDLSDAALAIEYFHTASLIADDLPCMDNDDMRRNQPSLHKMFGETTALLASYTLISAGNASIASCAHSFFRFGGSYEVGILALEHAARNTGGFGATGGQFLDIYPPPLSLDVLRNIIQKKTSSLFEVAFLFGWLFGGGNLDQIETVRRLASHFGMAFQIADDLGDVKQDAINDRKINVAAFLGPEKAVELLKEEIAGYRSTLQSLGLATEKLLLLANALE